VRNVSRNINDDNGFLYCKQSLRAKNIYETSDGIRYILEKERTGGCRGSLYWTGAIHFKLTEMYRYPADG